MKKVERICRDRYLTDEEAARYAKIRREVEEEYGVHKRVVETGGPLSELLRQAIRKSGRSSSELSSVSGVSPRMIERFTAGERTIPLEVADRLAEVLGLHLKVA